MKRVVLSCFMLLMAASVAHAQVEAEAGAGGAQQPKAVLEKVEGSKKEAAANATKQTTQKPKGEAHQLALVEVKTERNKLGQSSIGGQALKSLPSYSGTVTEALKGMSNVQFSNDFLSSQTAGEIKPPRISIAGADPWENNYLIDGMSITNRINPNGLKEATGQNNLLLSGGDQTIFYNTRLLENINVYSSNVPAKFGGFTGGVVDSKLRDPKTDEWHFELEGKHTRSKWFSLRGVDQESQSADSQPKFSVNSYSGIAEGPINDSVSVLFAVARRHSTIPLLREENDGTINDDDQERISDNYFGKLMIRPDDDFWVSFDATYAPYTEKRWRKAWPGSDWDRKNEPLRLATQAMYNSAYGKFTGKAQYSFEKESRDAESSTAYINSKLDIRKGGTGNNEQETQRVELSLDYDSEEYTAGILGLNVSTGVQYSYATTDVLASASNVETDVLLSGNRRILTDARYAETKMSSDLATFAYYLQSEVRWDRLTLTPGMRAEYDDFSGNIDIAPRLKAEYDTFGDGSLRVVGGYNRYYAGDLRSKAFDRYRPYVNYQQRDMNGDGVFESVSERDGPDKTYVASDLQTPYSDELTLGILGEVLGFEYGVELLERKSRKGLESRSVDKEHYEWVNGRSSDHKAITLTLARAVQTTSFGNHVFSLSATQSETEKSNNSYDDEVYKLSHGVERDYDKVYYNGSLVSRGELPADNYNSKFTVTFGWQGHFFEDSLRLNSVTRWEDSSSGLRGDARASSDTPSGTTSGRDDRESTEWMGEDGNYHDAYKHGVISGSMITDLGVEWDAYKDEDLTFTMLLNVNNVFDEAKQVSMTEGESSRGRSFYAGVRCEF